MITDNQIGDYLSEKEKLKKIANFMSISNTEMGWKILQPNEHGDWLNLRNEAFDEFIPIGDKDFGKTFFQQGLYCRGLETARDSWVYQSSTDILSVKLTKSIEFYNAQLE